METIKLILKDYGAAIGPALAFALGLAAIYGKHQIDRWLSGGVAKKRLGELRKLILALSFPEFFPLRSDGFLHADQARNLTNLSRLYSRLQGLKPLFTRLELQLAESGTGRDIETFQYIKWSYDILVKDIEKWRSDDKWAFNVADHANLKAQWENLHDGAKGGLPDLIKPSR